MTPATAHPSSASNPEPEDSTSVLFDLLYAVVHLLNQQEGQEEKLTRLLNLMEERVGFRRMTLMLLSANQQELHLETTRGVEQHDSLRYQRGEGITGRVLQEGRPAIIPTISREPDFRSRIHDRQQENMEKLGFICVPVILEQEVIGTLSADIAREGRFSLEESQRFLSVVASLIAFDVNARRIASIERAALENEQLRLRHALGERFRPENILGNSHPMRILYERIFQVAPIDTTVLIRGESGTGKELIASAIHYGSPRADKPFIRVNCSALNEQLIESELFGHERGAFTGAMSSRKGRIEEAEGGTLFLDEIGEFSTSTQVKLLRLMQEREFQRVGSNQTRKADIRFLAATNRNLEEEIAQGNFREDFFYRINVFPIHVPALRDRKDDILLLANHFVQKFARSMNKSIDRISTTAINMMMAYHWPGNVRELENCVEHAVVLTKDNAIHGHNLPSTLQMPSPARINEGSFSQRIQQLETDMITDALKVAKGNVTAAARRLGLTPRIVRYKIDKYNITLDEEE